MKSELDGNQQELFPLPGLSLLYPWTWFHPSKPRSSLTSRAKPFLIDEVLLYAFVSVDTGPWGSVHLFQVSFSVLQMMSSLDSLTPFCHIHAIVEACHKFFMLCILFFSSIISIEFYFIVYVSCLKFPMFSWYFPFNP